MRFRDLLEVSEDIIQAILIVPAFMKSLKHVDELRLVKTVEVGHNGIKFMDHVLLFVNGQRPNLDSYRVSPNLESLI